MTSGTFPGHSGGPVIDAAGHALAGILVEGSERGRFDRFVPVTLIARVWPRLPRPWLMTGAEPGEARSHFTRRARGQRSAARGGDLFRGRAGALDRVRGWLTADEPPGQPLVITGQPGAGKSAVLARAALSVEAGHGGPGLAFHARAATIGDFLTALADLTGVDTPASADELVTSLADLPGQPPIPVVLDALDEAASDRDRRQIAEALAELAVLPGLRVAVATRPLAAGNPYAPGGLLPALGVTTRDDHNLIDLDSDTYFDLDGLRQFAAALLAQDGMDHPGPPGAAWTQYRARPAVCDRLAAVIAERAGRNFLVAAMAAVPLSTARTMIDPAARGFDPADIPSGVGEALSKYLDRLPEQRRERDRGLLTALAYARGAGLDDPAWLAFAAALGYSATVADLDVLRRSPAADYLLQTTTTERGARPVTRLFHQALTDELLAARHQPSDESALLDMLLGQAERTGWQDRYLREHAAEHAAAAGPARSASGGSALPAHRRSGPAGAPPRRRTIRPGAGHRRRVPAKCPPPRPPRPAGAGQPARTDRPPARLPQPGRPHRERRPRPALADPLVPRSPGHRPPGPHRPHRRGVRGGGRGAAGRHPGHRQRRRRRHGAGVAAGRRHPGRGAAAPATTGRVNAVAVGALPDGTPVIVSGGDDGTVRVWRLADGTPVGEPLRGHDGAVNAVAVGALPDGTPVIVSGGDDGTVRVWRLADGTPVGEPLRGHAGGVHAVAVGALPDGTPVIVSGGDDGTVRVWRLADGTPVGEPLRGHTGEVDAVAVGALPDGTPVIVSGGGDGTVRVWRLADGTPVGEPLRGHDRRGERGGGRGAAGRHPGHRQRRRRRHGAGVAAGRRHPGRGAAARPHRRGERGGGGGAAGRHPGHRQRRRRRHGAGVAAGRRHPGRGAAARPHRRGERGGGGGAAGRHPGHRQRRRRRHGAGVAAGRRHPGRGAAAGHDRRGGRGGGRGAAGRHPGHRQRRRRRHGAGVAAGRRHPGRGAAAPATTGAVNAVAVGALPDGTPVIVSGGGDGDGAGVAAGRRHPGRGAAAPATPAR